jgi:O-acetyl-ADP-ribose deacetylase (regulator of RNase III)
VEASLKALLQANYGGEIPVGTAVIVPTGHSQIRYLISAPTMRVPCQIANTVNVYLAFRAALMEAKKQGNIKTILSPALGTGIGEMPPHPMARQMHVAFQDAVKGESQWRVSARSVLSHHAFLLA